MLIKKWEEFWKYIAVNPNESFCSLKACSSRISRAKLWCAFIEDNLRDFLVIKATPMVNRYFWLYNHDMCFHFRFTDHYKNDNVFLILPSHVLKLSLKNETRSDFRYWEELYTLFSVPSSESLLFYSTIFNMNQNQFGFSCIKMLKLSSIFMHCSFSPNILCIIIVKAKILFQRISWNALRNVSVTVGAKTSRSS